MCACLCVCLSAIISPELHVQSSTHFLLHVTYGRGSVLLLRCIDTLCTSGFMDDVIFAQKPRLLDVAAQQKRSAHAVRSNMSCRQRTHGTTFRALKVTSRVAKPGAESAVYDCLVCYLSTSQCLCTMRRRWSNCCGYLQRNGAESSASGGTRRSSSSSRRHSLYSRYRRDLHTCITRYPRDAC